jgi:DNA-directed RNA polymerase II subunit RPB2
METISWKILDTYFKDKHNFVAHHINSYNDFFDNKINKIFRENNPIRVIHPNKDKSKAPDQMLLYLGGKQGDKIYFGKPVIYDDKYSHFMYPNDARLRNMTYGLTIHYDVDVEIITLDNEDKEKVVEDILPKIYLGNFPIMLQSNLCVLNTLTPEVRFNMGECRHDNGGYFIIQGKEKLIICQEKFADNMLYIRAHKDDNVFSHSAEIRSVSEDTSKPVRTTAVNIVSPTTVLSNCQIVVSVPNVRKPVPLFILMRALGLQSDKQIIEYCLLDLPSNESYIDLFIPSIHDANKIFNQETAIKYIATFTKRQTITSVLDILINYLVPHVGETNLLDKAYFIGYMVNKLLRVYTKENKPTDRDNFKYKRIELSGSLIYELFKEYYLIQKRDIELSIQKKLYYHTSKQHVVNLSDLISENYNAFFKNRIVYQGFNKAFKGNWGAQTHTKRIGVVQDLNRLSWFTFISQLRKFNLPMDSSAKVVGPRLLNSSQWGYIDPVDTPDGGNIGLHKHMSIMCAVSNGYSIEPLIKWLSKNTPLKLLKECNPSELNFSTKILVNGRWIGIIENEPTKLVKLFKLYRRNGILPIYTSISFNYENNEIFIYTDAGRLTRPIYYIESGKISYLKYDEDKEYSWEQLTTGFIKKTDSFLPLNNIVYDIDELYPSLEKREKIDLDEDEEMVATANKNEVRNKRSEIKELIKNSAIIDYIDVSEEESLLISPNESSVPKNNNYTNVEIDPSLILGIMGNSAIFPENNPLPRNSFSCGQSKQAVSLYHSNYQMRMDKMGVVLNYGQIPLVKSRHLSYINNEEMPYGINTIVAIMSYTGYNVEDAILINKGALDRGLFRTTYFTMYEDKEESSTVKESTSNTRFTDVQNQGNPVSGLKPGYDYSYLDKYGLVKENTQLNDKIVIIGKISTSGSSNTDDSTFTKKGQLGYVDKSFITEGEEGFRIAKVRVCEERIPAIGDKMASRSGQKGTIGLVLEEKDMPFTSSGLKPDIIINPHALPSRMTIAQLLECLLGNAAVYYGGFGDSTAFQTKGPNVETYGSILQNAGFSSSGNQLLYNGQSGQQITSEIFIGPTYYMRLKHMVKDKINYRARGPRTMLTRQTVQGRANDGGLRLGEMERDGILAHGASAFLNESYLVRGDEYYMAVCNKSGSIAIYNKNSNIFLSPMVDGPIQFNTTLDGKMNVENISRFGRSFSIVKIPYSLKLMIQELQVMNIQMRIITEDNIDQLMSLSYSNNINKLLHSTDEFPELINKYQESFKKIILKSKESLGCVVEKILYPDFNNKYKPGGQYSPDYIQPTSSEAREMSNLLATHPLTKPGFNDFDSLTPSSAELPINQQNDDEWLITDRDTNSPLYVPDKEEEETEIPTFKSPFDSNPSNNVTFNPITQQYEIKDSQLKADWDSHSEKAKGQMMQWINNGKIKKSQWATLSPKDKELMKSIIKEQKEEGEVSISELINPSSNSTMDELKVDILKVDEPIVEEKEEDKEENNGDNVKKQITFT